jgi:hypothetical protein
MSRHFCKGAAWECQRGSVTNRQRQERSLCSATIPSMLLHRLLCQLVFVVQATKNRTRHDAQTLRKPMSVGLERHRQRCGWLGIPGPKPCEGGFRGNVLPV